MAAAGNKSGSRGRVMKWKQDLEALIESTMAFANEVKRRPTPEFPVALRTIPPVTAIAPIVLPTSERDEIRQRVNNFKAHQEKMAREREDYYSQMKARMITPVLINSKKAPPA
jgi:hypothetical protein